MRAWILAKKRSAAPFDGVRMILIGLGMSAIRLMWPGLWNVCVRSDCGRRLVVALEPTGTYGDALRQALVKADLEVHRVSPKQASDYAEVFDGVPSQHDGKDAAIIAELAAQGRSWPWPMKTPSEMEQELAYQVEWMDGQRRQMMLWCGRVEALLSRHWPEATRLVQLTSGTLLRCLAEHGGPRGLAGAVDAQRACADGHVSICRRKKRSARGHRTGKRPGCRWVAGTKSGCGVTRGRYSIAEAR